MYIYYIFQSFNRESNTTIIHITQLTSKQLKQRLCSQKNYPTSYDNTPKLTNYLNHCRTRTPYTPKSTHHPMYYLPPFIQIISYPKTYNNHTMHPDITPLWVLSKPTVFRNNTNIYNINIYPTPTPYTYMTTKSNNHYSLIYNYTAKNKQKQKLTTP